MNLNEKEIAFIICVNNEMVFQECLYYINRLQIPEEYTIDVITVRQATSMCEAYNEAMKSSQAKYKVYLHQDVCIRNVNFISDIISLFVQDEQLGMIGMMGATQMPKSGTAFCAWDVGFIDAREPDLSYYMKGFREVVTDTFVEAIDGLMMITQYDISWREDLFQEFDFYDVSQSFEMRKCGYKVLVPYTREPWVVHDSGFAKLVNYDKNRKKCIREYPEFFYAEGGFEFTYHGEWEELSEELVQQIKQLLEQEDWNAIKQIITMYRQNNMKSTQLEIIAIILDIYEVEQQHQVLHGTFEGLHSFEKMYQKYQQIRFLLRRVELKLPSKEYCDLENALKMQEVSIEALVILTIHAISDKHAVLIWLEERCLKYCNEKQLLVVQTMKQKMQDHILVSYTRRWDTE